MQEETFSNLGKVEAISRLLEESGFGKDGGCGFEPKNGSFVHTASRTFLEGTDFDLVYFPLKHLGYKCVAALSGELYAALAHPRTMDVRLGVSAKLDYSQVKELWEGMSVAAREFGIKSLSVDLVPSPNGLAVSVSVCGEEFLLTRKGRPKAKSMDLVCVSGSLGAAYLGQQVLERGKRSFEKDGRMPELENYRMLVGSYLKPELSPGTVDSLEESGIYPSLGVLVSHGLSDAVKRISRQTSLGVKIYADKIPFEGNSFSLGKELDIDPVSAAMNGGDDFRLLYVIPILQAEKFRRDFQSFDIIGHLAKSDVGEVLVTPDGVELPIKAQGWNDPEEDQ